MKVKIDLHIHSALSPCADKDNTLGNIINMSLLNRVDFIAIADHNSAKNCQTAIELGEKVGVIVVPALEVTTSEEIHILCLFKNVQKAIELSDFLEERIPKYKLDNRLYLPQLVLNNKDETIEEIDYLLSVATSVGIYDLCKIVAMLDGVAIPSHVDKDSNSIISILGEIPDDLNFNIVEVSKNISIEQLDTLKKRYKIIQDSDAHCLDELCFEQTEIDIDERTLECFFEYLKKKETNNK